MQVIALPQALKRERIGKREQLLCERSRGRRALAHAPHRADIEAMQKDA